MATDIVTDQAAALASDVAPTTAGLPRYTPEDHAAASALKIERLVSLGTNEHGKTATFEFAGGFVRSIDVDVQNVWHSVLCPIVGADWGRLLRHVAPHSRCEDGTLLIQLGPMWFWTDRTTPRGRFLSSNYFDVPQEDYAHGCLTGARAARDLILFLRQYERAREARPIIGGLEMTVQRCLEEAFTLASARRSGDAPSTGPAAHVFSQTVMRFFVAGTGNANPAYLEGEVERAQATVAWSEDYDERQREQVADRMRAVRAAKAIKRAQGSTGEVASNGMTSMPGRAKFIEGASASGHTLQ
jgi:hypothetical protein